MIAEGSSLDFHIGISLLNGQDSSSVIERFTIKNAFDTSWNAAAIFYDSTTPTIRNCVIIDNMCSGIFSDKVHSKRIRIENCTVSDNYWSGLLTNYSTSAFITNSEFSNNGSSGAFIHTSVSATTEVRNSLFYNNGSYGLSVLQDLGWENIRLSNNTFVGNSTGLLIESYFPKNNEIPPTISLQAVTEVNNNISAFNTDIGDTFGNISLDPLFCDTAVGNFHIEDGSSCAPTNNSCDVLKGAFDVGCGGCCENRGNADHIIGPSGPIDVADLSYLTAYLFQGGPILPCEEEGNVDGVTGPSGPIDVGDLSYLVAYLFQGGPLPPGC